MQTSKKIERKKMLKIENAHDTENKQNKHWENYNKIVKLLKE